MPAFHLLEGLFNLVSSFTGGDDVEPVLLRRLIVTGENLHLIAACQLLANRYIAIADTCSCAHVSHLGVNGIGKVQHSGTCRQLKQISFGCKDKYFILGKLHPELIHQLVVISALKSTSHACQPFFHTTLSTLDAFVSPMSSQAVFGNVVHALGTYLYLHPFLFRAQYGDVQTLIAIAFRYRKPVAHTTWVALIHVRDDTEHLPAFLLFPFGCRVYNDTYGKEVKDAIDIHLLLLHLLPDGMNALGASLHMEFQSSLEQLLLYRFGETGYIGIPALLGGIQFLLYIIIRIMFQIFQAQVFQFALQLVESQFVCQWCIQVGRFHRHFSLSFHIAGSFDVAHETHTVGYHDKYDTHVLCHGYEQTAEVFAFDSCTLLIQVAYAQKSMHDTCHFLSEVFLDVLQGGISTHDSTVKHHSQYRTACQSHLLSHYQGSFHIGKDIAQAECITRYTMLSGGFLQILVYHVPVLLCENILCQQA